jgi:NAD(P)-dependent dehydrogenase (short-subunit alcohol dehydrogenase family)
MENLEGKVAFITGGASGVGLGQAKVFSAAGCRVVIADIRQDHLDEALSARARARVRTASSSTYGSRRLRTRSG